MNWLIDLGSVERGRVESGKSPKWFNGIEQLIVGKDCE